MGLDQYIYHVTKTHYDEQHTFNRSELSDHVVIPVQEIDLPMYAGLKPYCQKLKVLNEYYDVAKMRADHGLSDDAFIWRYTADSITIGDGKHDVEIDDETVRQKYTIQKVEEEYVCHTHEVYYWRKAYDVREWFEDHIDSKIENCGYYPLSAETLEAFDRRFLDANFPRIPPDENSELVYHEWY